MRGLTATAALWLAAVAPTQGLPGELRTVDGRTLVGALTVDADGRATLAQADGAVTLALAEVTSFVRADAPTALPATAPHRVWLRSGQELPAKALRGRAAADGAASRLVVELPSGVTVELPIAAVRALRHGGAERPEPPRLTADFDQPPDNEDVLFVQKDGQAHRSLVTITGFSDDRVDFLLRGQAYDFPLVATTGIVFGRNTGFAPDRQPKPRTALVLATGETLVGRLLELQAEARLRIDEGAEVLVPLAALARLDVQSDRLVRLGELSPKVEQTPAFDRVWPWGVDRTPAGPGFVIAGEAFARGIGMVPRTRLTYDLGGAYDLFEARIGIDDRGGPAAHAICRVLVDGRVAYESPPLVRGTAALPVSVELGRCRTLAIECDFGKNYDLGDFCAWVCAHVVQR
ncbi:MAG: NPCBM/NEW2 domain-containing protein [Planctomycetes bacterium]|nr:NPCBM/NEW2 domain-containing protein [Planctomycetota bacterium]